MDLILKDYVVLKTRGGSSFALDLVSFSSLKDHLVKFLYRRASA